MLSTDVFQYRPTQNHRRIDWFYQTYARTENVDIHDFLNLVNRSYYKYSAECYDERFVDDIRSVVGDLLRERAWDEQNPITLVDIGAGTGLTYDLATRLGLPLAKYVFLEPNESMANEFRKRTIASNYPLEILVEPFSNFASKTSDTSRKFFILNSTLHHVVWMNDFFNDLKRAMNPGDQIAFCHEPQNGFFRSPMRYLAGAWHALTTDYLLRRMGLQTKRSSQDSTRWDAINNELVTEGVVSKKLPPLTIRRIIDYWVGTKGDWQRLGIPKEFNEGFWTVADIQDSLGSGFTQVYFRSYRHFGDSGGRPVTNTLNHLAAKLLPRSGSVMSVVFQRTADERGDK